MAAANEVKRLVVEGWRSSSHSYALVNQHQLLHLLEDPRFEVAHVDLPFFRAHWREVDAGFPPGVKARLLALPPPRGGRADVIYRISWPMHLHAGAAERVFVFGTCEFGKFEPGSFCGPAGTAEGVDPQAAEIITSSQWSKQGFLNEGFAPERVHVIPLGVEPAEYAPATAEEKRALRAEFNIPADAVVFLNIGSMTWNKGIGPLLAAFAEYRLRDPRALLLLKGSDALYGNLTKGSGQEALQRTRAIADPKVLQSIRYMNQNFSRADLAQLYRMSDAYVCPYRAEGFAITVLEAMACGIPVVVTAGGSTDDFAPDHLALRVAAEPVTAALGNYLEPDLNSLLACLGRIAADRPLADRVAIEGPRWVAERYSWAAVTRTLADLLAS